MKRLRMNRHSDATVRKLRPHPASFKRSIGRLPTSMNGDIVFVLDAPPGEGEGDIYATVAVPAGRLHPIRAESRRHAELRRWWCTASRGAAQPKCSVVATGVATCCVIGLATS